MRICAVGLSDLVNEDSAEPHKIILVLQLIFDRFDQLTAIFNVQKVFMFCAYYLAARLRILLRLLLSAFGGAQDCERVLSSRCRAA